MANIFWTEHDIDNQAALLESTRGPLHRLHCLKMSWTVVQKRLKTGPELLPTLSILFRPYLTVHAVKDIYMASHGESTLWTEKKHTKIFFDIQSTRRDRL